MKPFFLMTLACMGMTLTSYSFAADKAKSKEAKEAKEAKDAKEQEQASGERVNVDAIKEKYWARGEETELGVVQNRAYTKARKFEIGAFGGLVSSDPFLDVQTAGISLGYHFNEYFAAHALGWKHFVSSSNALKTFEATRGATTNTNEPRAFYGAEAVGSILYGKLSLLGWKILHYDFHLLLGGGMTNTETGNYATGIVGVGQQVYIGNSVSLRVDYRLMPYHENIAEKVIPSKMGQVVGSRMNWSNSITFGVTYLFDFPGASK